MKQTTPISIRVVANGYIVNAQENNFGGMCESPNSLHIFTDAASLVAFVTQFYAENHPQPVAVEQWQGGVKVDLIPDSDSEHNPEKLTPEQVGISDGWRLLRKSEIKSRAETDAIQGWMNKRWDKSGWEGSAEDASCRTKVAYGQLDAK
jgi:hypothetical protein